jgi:hypothetical protein
MRTNTNVVNLVINLKVCIVASMRRKNTAILVESSATLTLGLLPVCPSSAYDRNSDLPNSGKHYATVKGFLRILRRGRNWVADCRVFGQSVP